METKKSPRKTAFSGPEGLKFLARMLNGEAKGQVEMLRQEAARLKSLSAQQKSKSENPYLLPQEGLQSPNPTAPGYVGTYSPTPPYEVESEKPIEANPAAPASPDSVP